jgi:hypothetical protein
MKVCFVVIAHHQPRIFHQLVRNIAHETSDVVIHIDRRVDPGAFQGVSAPNVHYMKKRYRVNWSGWSLTRTIVAALEYALKVSDASYFVYLAGTDFPIQPQAALSRYLAGQYPANILNYYPLVPGIWGYALIDRFYFNDLLSYLIDIRDLKNKPAGIRGRLADLVFGLQGVMNKRYQPRDSGFMNFYSGSSRWCLNRDTVQFVVDYYHGADSTRLKNYLRCCANSDEIFFQTTILNSVHRQQCFGFDETEARAIFAGEKPAWPDEKRVYLHYIDWSPEREDPAILTEADFDSLVHSGKYFACKFMDDRSLGLVDLLARSGCLQ